MNVFVALLMTFHGAIHFMGFAKAFEIAPLAQLKRPISRPWGVVWLVAGVLFLAGALLLVGASTMWWTTVAPAVVLSQLAIVACWQDAKLGTIANAIVLVPLAISLLERERDLAARVSVLGGILQQIGDDLIQPT